MAGSGGSAEPTGPPWPRHDRGTGLIGAGLAVVAVLLWVPLLLRTPVDLAMPPTADGWDASAPILTAVGTTADLLFEWAVLLLAVTLPGAVPVLARYGQRARPETGDRAGGGRLAFVAAYLGAWIAVAGAACVAQFALAAAAAASPAVPAHRPYLIAAALVVAGLYQASQPREDWLTACRRAGAAAGAAPPGYRAALVCGRAHALRSIGANAGLVVALAAGAPLGAGWALLVAAVSLAERARPGPRWLATATGTALVALGLLAAASPQAVAGARGALALPDLGVAPGVPGGARLLHTLTGHTGSVMALAFGPDGELLASGGWDPEVRVWSVATGELRWVLPLGGPGPGQHEVLCLAFSSDGALLAAGASDGTVTTWDARIGARVGAFGAGPTDAEVIAVAIAPDRRRLVGVDVKGVLTVWDMSAGRRRSLSSGGDPWRPATAFSPDGALLAAAPREGGVDLWDAAYRHVRRLVGTQPIAQLTFSPDGASLAGGGPGAPTVTLWDVGDRREPRQLAMPGGAQDLAFSRDGAALVAVNRDGELRVWRTADGGEQRTLRYPVRGRATAAVAPDGRRVASVSPVGAQNAVELWALN